MVNRTSSFFKKARGVREGYRSGLEDKVAEELEALGVPFSFESLKIPYVIPATDHTYTPDFILPNGIIIETKGRFLIDDRKKHLYIQQQHPELDIRFVFSTSRAKISPGAKTTLAEWCLKNGFKYADKSIPREWIEESCPAKRLTG